MRYANPAVEVITGYSRQELLEMNFWDIACPDFRELLRERGLARQRGEHVPLRYEFKIVTKAGEERWLDFTDGTFEFEGKLAVIGLCFDITERKRAEEAVRKSHQLLNLVLATLPVGVAVVHRTGNIVLVNAASKRIWGGMIASGRERWAQTKGFWHDSGKRIAPTNWASVRALSEGQTSLNELIDIETYDDQQKTIRNSAAPIRNAEGLIVGAVIVNEDVTEQVRAEQALRTTTEQLRALTAKLQSVREEEDRRIGRELHDEIGSAMAGLKWDLEGLDKLCSEASGQIDCSTLRERINGMVELVDTATRTVQKISSELRPAILDDLGLIAAIEWQSQQFEARTGIVCQFDSSVESIDLDREKATAVFRIIQEALINILRHAQATRVNIIIEKEDGELIVEVKDNGRGIKEEEKARSSSLGLIGMQERAYLLGGRIEITGFAGKGSLLTVRVPISNQGSG
jgi:PAS domain S-box-containing protein